MVQEKICRSIALVVVISALIGMIYYGSTSIRLYQIGMDNVTNGQSKVHTEMLRTIAIDGFEIKGIYFIAPEMKDYSNHSIPLIICCHGMSSDYFQFWDFAYTLTTYGYAVFAPEFRGHGSGSAPSSLGYMESRDILTWLDYFEENIEAVNVSNSAAFGHSMGAMFATLAYVFESKDQGRFKCLVEGSGPVNLTREIDFLTNNPEPLGSLAFINNIEEKNPINYVNETFPNNMMILHGDEDGTVDFKCAEDFIRKIDPIKLTNASAGRTDIEYIVLEGSGHSLDSQIFYGNAMIWFERYIRNNNFSTDDFVILSNPIQTSQGKDNLLLTCIFMIFLIPALIYLIRPKIFSKSEQTQKESKSNPLNKKQKGILLGAFFGIYFIAGAICLAIPSYLVSEVGVPVLMSLIYLILLMKMHPNQEYREMLKNQIQSMNLQSSFIGGLSIIGMLIVYFFVSSSKYIEDSTLTTGGRITWWIPYMSMVIALQFFTNLVFIRSLFGDKIQGPKQRIGEIFLQGILTGLLMGIFVWYYWGMTYFSIPAWFDFFIDMALVVVVLFGGLYFIFDIIIQLFEKITKSPIPAIIGCSVLVPIAVGSSYLIFFY